MKLLTALRLLCIVSMQFLIADAEDGVHEKCFKTTEPLEMTCFGLGEKAIWVKEKGTLEPNAKIEVMDGHSVFKIEKANLNHAGKYSCKEGASKQTFEAQLAATIRELPSFINAVEGANLTLYCDVYGTPLDMDVEWYKGDDYINNPESNSEHRNTEILIIPEMKAEDSGKYTCKASNRCGQASQSVNIRVFVKKTDAEDGVHKKCFRTSEPLEMTCSGLGEKAIWVKEEGTLEHNAKIEVMDGHSVFKIENANLDHAGKYSCKEGASKQTFEAQLAATIQEFPASANIVEGENYTLKCEVYGTPLDMDVKWYKDDEHINFTKSHPKHRNMSEFIITEIKAEDSGKYTCKASNRCGQASRSINIHVVGCSGKKLKFTYHVRRCFDIGGRCCEPVDRHGRRMADEFRVVSGRDKRRCGNCYNGNPRKGGAAVSRVSLRTRVHH